MRMLNIRIFAAITGKSAPETYCWAQMSVVPKTKFNALLVAAQDDHVEAGTIVV